MNEVKKDLEEILRQVSKELYAQYKGIDLDRVSTSSPDYLKFCKNNINRIQDIANRRFDQKHIAILKERVSHDMDTCSQATQELLRRTEGTDR